MYTKEFIKQNFKDKNGLVNTKYFEWYFNLIKNSKPTAGYTENHHILPKSMFKNYSKEKENITSLSLREHFVAHLLLCNIFPKSYKLAQAVTYMMNKHKNKVKLTSRQFEKVKNICFEEYSKRTKNTVSVLQNGKFERIRTDTDYFIENKNDFIFPSSNRFCVLDKDNKVISILKEDFDSLKHISIFKDTVCVKDENGAGFRVSKNNPLYLSGKYVGITTGMKYMKGPNGELRRVFENETTDLLKSGWIFANNTTDTFRVNKNGIEKVILKEELCFYLENGWNKGRNNYYQKIFSLNRIEKNNYPEWWIADEIVDILIKNPKIKKVALNKLVIKLFSHKYLFLSASSTVYDNIIKKFKKGWIPSQDPDWLTFKNSYKP